jgi:UDP-N-acetylbacillosamine N-acetyltransferase
VKGKSLIIYGAGGHGLVVAEAAALAGFAVTGFIDDEVEIGSKIRGWRVLGRSGYAFGETAVIVAVGDNASRHKIIQRLDVSHVKLATVIHPIAAVSTSAKIGPGVFIGPMAVINAEATIGSGAIVNSAAVVEHHCSVGEAAHVAPGAVLAGRVTVGARSLIGTGAVVIPLRVIGEDAVVGAGAVVIRDVAVGTKVVGNPARAI